MVVLELYANQLYMKHTFTLLLLTASCGVSAQWLTDSLIAHFPMDGTPDDTVGSLSPITTLGAPSYCADRNGTADHAACFQGSDFWRYGDVLEMATHQFSIAFWCRVDGLTPGSIDHDYPFAKGTTAFAEPALSGYAFGFRDEFPDTLNAACLWGQGTQPLVIKDHPVSFGAWAHYCMSRCSDDVILYYVNGSLVATDTLDADADLTTNIYFGIGAGDRAPSGQPVGGFFRGAIDDLRIYKGRCLSESEINMLADLTLGADESKEVTSSLGLFPNPAISTLRIELPSSVAIIGPLMAFDPLGLLIPLPVANLVMGNEVARSLSIDVSSLTNGAYFLVVPMERGMLRGRFIKE